MVAEFDLMSVCWLVLLKIEPIYDSGVQHTPIKYRGRLSWRPHLFPKAIAGLGLASSRIRPVPTSWRGLRQASEERLIYCGPRAGNVSSECIVIFGAVPIHRLDYAIGGRALVGLFLVFVTVANLKI